MKIIEIELYKYRRFNLNHIERFRYTIGQKSQIILGTNGSGKSSLLSELSPLPSKSKNFYEGGFKRIIIEHRNSRYVLTSDSANKHSLLKDDVELNEGHTFSVQKQLVMQEFNLNDKLFSILSGKINFCDMNIGERRKWFTYLSDNDYDYIGSVYDKIREKYHSLQSDLKSIMIFKEKEIASVLSDADIQVIRKTIAEYRQSIDALNAIKQNVSQEDSEIHDQIRSTEKQIQDTIEIYRRYLRELNYFVLSRKNIGQLNKDLSDLNQEIYKTDGKIETLVTQLDALTYQINNLSDTESQSTIQNRLNEIQEILNSERSIEIENISELYHCFQSVKENLQNTLMELPENSQRQFSKDVLENVEKRLSENSSQTVIFQDTEQQLRRIWTEQENALLDTNKVSCPQCHYTWQAGYDPIKHRTSKEEWSKITELLTKLSEEKIHLTQQKEEILNYSAQYRSFIQFFKVYPILQYVHDQIKETVLSNPQQAIQKLDQLFLEIQTAYKHQLLLDEQKQLQSHQSSFFSDPDKIKADLIRQKNDLDQQIHILYNENRTHKSMEKLYKEQVEILEKIQRQQDALLHMSQKLDTFISDSVKSALNKGINEVLKDLLTKMLNTQNLLADNDRHEDAIREFERQEKNIKESLEVVKILETILSPKAGIIADSLIGFINTILAYINDFVSEIWTYPIEIIPVEIEENDILDYKFKVKINDNEVIDDISESSSGLKEIINLGFKICVMSYLNFKGYPIYLDEFGSTFDMQHRFNTSSIISDLVNDDMFSNIFMISHYEESYGSMKNTDVIVMHDANISIPQGSLINQNVLIEVN